ncbi:MAG: DinB family protein [Candidatus Melainabacteria bacterium]|nr:DinB family protein [Candidatus Melainabacteria bacterium]
MANATIPKLDKPGAGLPFYEWAVANYILVPLRLNTTSIQKALAEVETESAQIDAMVSPLSVTQLNEQRLIPRLIGLEDSSRFWSVAMALEHIVIVNSRALQLVKALSKGISPAGKSSTADVKPGEVDASTIVSKFLSNSKEYVDVAASLNLDAHPNVTYEHPWFGKMNAKQWVLFAAPHMGIHRKQIAEIIHRL